MFLYYLLRPYKIYIYTYKNLWEVWNLTTNKSWWRRHFPLNCTRVIFIIISNNKHESLKATWRSKALKSGDTKPLHFNHNSLITSKHPHNVCSSWCLLLDTVTVVRRHELQLVQSLQTTTKPPWYPPWAQAQVPQLLHRFFASEIQLHGRGWVPDQGTSKSRKNFHHHIYELVRLA